ncbi:Trk system potassium transporter TrkA [Paracoccus sp. Z118]|uniref:Trk system potassium transporter TrkA n=1 Tax=Paracoccus sp. Z118 TaxID=2851017 RepID=UPI001C2C3865|nr:Trk system potassium transporter TrkA [Paracoccus sp. Z118]MBV0892020.1 Trk system potassium transporter TrkA [Paracoccus sp. Z118]
MKIIICGAGQVGWQIARHLAGERNDITVIDLDAELIRRATDMLDVQGVTGFASHPDVLAEAGAADCDLLIAATHSDEVNIVACEVANSIFQVPRKIARIRAASYLDPGYAGMYGTAHLPIDVVISPEREVARAAMQRLQAPATFDVETFMRGKVWMLGMSLTEDCPILHASLRQLGDMFADNMAVVVGVRRGGRLFAPEPADQLFAGDQIYVVCPAEQVDRTLDRFGKPTALPQRVIVVGAGHVGLAVAQEIDRKMPHLNAKLIERDRRQAEAAADTLRQVVVLHGDGMSAELLIEAGVARADAVMMLTQDDKTNLLGAVRARALGAGTVVSLLNDPTLIPLRAALGIDAYVDPRAATVSTILRHIRHGRVRDLYSIGDAEAELIEAQVLPSSGFAGQLIGDLSLPAGALIGAVQKGDRLVKPLPDLRIEAGDIVLVFSLTGDVGEIDEMLQVGIDYF